MGCLGGLGMLLKSELHGSQTETGPPGLKRDTYSLQFENCKFLEWVCTALLDPILKEAISPCAT